MPGSYHVARRTAGKTLATVEVPTIAAARAGCLSSVAPVAGIDSAEAGTDADSAVHVKAGATESTRTYSVRGQK